MFQMLISKLTTYLRNKSIAVTDKRVRTSVTYNRVIASVTDKGVSAMCH